MPERQVNTQPQPIAVDLQSGLPISSIVSPTHAVQIEGDETSKSITLAKGMIIDNRDFVLGYRIAGQSVEAGLLTHRDQQSGYFSLMIEPPAVPDENNITPRSCN